MSAVVHMRRSRSTVPCRWALAITVLLVAAHAPAASGRSPSKHGDHVVGTYDGSTLRLFVDGREVASRPTDRRIAASTTPLEIGTFYAGQRWRGVIDEVTLYRRALSPAAIRKHYRVGVGAVQAGYASLVRRAPGVVAYWHLSEQAHRLAVDSLGRHTGRYPPGA